VVYADVSADALPGHLDRLDPEVDADGRDVLAHKLLLAEAFDEAALADRLASEGRMIFMRFACSVGRRRGAACARASSPVICGIVS
jgi:hypothetical protein